MVCCSNSVSLLSVTISPVPNTSKDASSESALPPPEHTANKLTKESNDSGAVKTQESKSSQNATTLPRMQDCNNASSSSIKNASSTDREFSQKKTVSSANVFASPSNLKTPVSRGHIGDLSVPGELGAELVEKIRTSTGLSHQDSIGAVSAVVCGIGHRVPALQTVMGKILEALQVWVYS